MTKAGEENQVMFSRVKEDNHKWAELKTDIENKFAFMEMLYEYDSGFSGSVKICLEDSADVRELGHSLIEAADWLDGEEQNDD